MSGLTKNPTTEQPDSKTRQRRLLVNIGGTSVFRALNLSATAISTALIVSSVGETAYGTIAAVVSASVFISYADLGLGLGLVNKLANAADTTAVGLRDSISRVYSVLSLVTFILLVVAASLAALEYRQTAFQIDESFIWPIAIVCTAVSIPASIAQRVLFAFERSVAANAYNTGARLFSLGCIYVAAKSSAPPTAFVVALLGAPAIVGWLSMYKIFMGEYRHLRPHIVYMQPKLIISDLKTGLAFTVLQLSVFVEAAIDNILILALSGPIHVTSYDLTVKLFSYIPALISIAVMPLWPSFRSAIAAGDPDWVQVTTNKARFLVLGGSSAAALILFQFHGEIVSAWTGVLLVDVESIAASWSILACLMAYSMFQSMIMSSRNQLTFQVKLQLSFIAISFLTKLAALYLFDVAVMAWSFVVIYAARVILVEWNLLMNRIPADREDVR